MINVSGCLSVRKRDLILSLFEKERKSYSQKYSERGSLNPMALDFENYPIFLWPQPFQIGIKK